MNFERRDELAMRLQDNVEELLEALGMCIEDFQLSDKCIRGYTFCHDGDNEQGFVYYFDSGFWNCYTRGCHEKHGIDLIGLIQVVKDCNFGEAMRFAGGFVKGRLNSTDLSKKKIARLLETKDYWEVHKSQETYHEVTLHQLSPAILYAKQRGFSPKIFAQLGIGYASKGSLSGRIVVPVRNIDKKIIGFTARKLHDNMNGAKWFHFQVQREVNLFNIDKAYEAMEIANDRKIILVEGPWDVVKLEMAGFPQSVATLGASVAAGQIELLNHMGVTGVILAYDNDDGGKKHLDSNREKLERALFSVDIILPEEDMDFGDMSIKSIQNLVSPHFS